MLFEILFEVRISQADDRRDLQEALIETSNSKTVEPSLKADRNPVFPTLFKPKLRNSDNLHTRTLSPAPKKPSTEELHPDLTSCALAKTACLSGASCFLLQDGLGSCLGFRGVGFRALRFRVWVLAVRRFV